MYKICTVLTSKSPPNSTSLSRFPICTRAYEMQDFVLWESIGFEIPKCTRFVLFSHQIPPPCRDFPFVRECTRCKIFYLERVQDLKYPNVRDLYCSNEWNHGEKIVRVWTRIRELIESDRGIEKCSSVNEDWISPRYENVYRILRLLSPPPPHIRNNRLTRERLSSRREWQVDMLRRMLM